MTAPPVMRPSRKGGCRMVRLRMSSGLQTVGQHHDDGEDHGGGADDGGADQNGLGGGLEGVAGAVVLFQVFLGDFEIADRSRSRA